MLNAYDRWLVQQAEDGASECDEDDCECAGRPRRVGGFNVGRLCGRHFADAQNEAADHAYELARDRALMKED